MAIDAVAGTPEALVRESADLLYNLTVLWAAVGVRPAEIWAEMDRRERLLGIAEKLPKGAIKPAAKLTKRAAPSIGTRPIVAAIEGGRLRKHR